MHATLEAAIGELALAVRTLQRLMIDKGVCSAEELHNKLQQVDLEDGKADGRDAAYWSATGIQAFVDTMEQLYDVLVARYRDEGRRPRWDYGKDFDFLPASS